MIGSRARGSLFASLALLSLAPLLQGCAGKEDQSGDLRAIIARTVSQSRHYTYSEKFAGHTAVVEASIQDDLRYKTSYSLDGSVMSEEVVLDDARALRIPDAKAADRVVPTVAIPQAAPSALTPGGTAPPAGAGAPSVIGLPAPERAGAAAQARPAAAAIELIHKGSWVVDAAGAGKLQRARTSKREELGDDQVRDALVALRHVTDAMTELGGAGSVVLFNPESIAYRGDLDPFPRPNRAAGELRYDLRQQGLPPRAGTAGGSSQAEREGALPGPGYFRSVSVYVKDGLVERVMESTSVLRALKNPDQDILQRIQDAGTPVPDSVKKGTAAVQAQFIEKTLVGLEVRRNQTPLRVHELSLVVTGLGAEQSVTLPADAAKASLTGILTRGLVLSQG